MHEHLINIKNLYLFFLQEDDSLLTLDNSFAALELMPEDSTAAKRKEPNKKVNPELEKLAAKFDEDLRDDDGDIFETEFAMHKRDYYMQKFGYEEVNRQVKNACWWNEGHSGLFMLH